MKIPAAFDDIRPFEPEELPQVYDRLLADPQFRAVMAYAMPDVPFDQLAALIRSCHTNLEFQMRLCHGFLHRLLDKASAGCTMDTTAVSAQHRYTFVSNHRDIVLDSAFLSVMLIDHHFPTTCEIAIGDNLLSLPWVKDLVRVNKSFIVRRGLSPRETLASSKLMSDYMHFVIEEKQDNIWIAQREGRAKDSDDLTQPAILKMMAFGGQRGSVQQRLSALHIVPLAISYEYDPCDWLKAQEFQLKRDVPGWKKSKQDDVVSMQTGIMGYKGRIHYHAAPCIDQWLEQLDPATPKTEIFDIIAAHIDQEIHRNYRLYPCNYVALDMLNGSKDHSAQYTAHDEEQFAAYLDAQLSKIVLPDKDEPYLRQCMLKMYANPVVNHLKAAR